ncbi:sensor histidine kinase [Acuticoccus kandeliae]|uniref:sensor histidine kinase n=1 Tax=Acuticoccus kandeliae TaxID=2073160 RepID=UPI000D3ECD91|nr:HAMP domain-containing sensor histidine kinase [Acuticoccus kandeliae]
MGGRLLSLRKWSDLSLKGQMVTLFLAAFVPSEMIAVAIDVYQISDEHRAETQDRATAFLSESLSAIRAAPDERESVAGAFAGSGRSLHLGAEPAVATSTPSRLVDAERLGRTLAAALPIGELRVSGDGRPERDAEFIALSVRLRDDPVWYNFTLGVAPIEWVPLLASRSIDTLVAVLMTVIVVVLTGRIMQPLRRLVVNADRFGRGEDIGRIEPEGSADVRETIEAFNRMAERVTQTLDYQVALMRSLGHDLKGPLHRARDDAAEASPEAVRERLFARLDHVETLVEAVSSFARATRRDGETVRVDMPSLLEALVDDAADAGEDASMAVAAPAIVRGRRDALARAFQNLIENALKYGGAARVTLAREGGSVVVFVDDDGPGIPPDAIEAAFRPFERLSADRAGTGLGLAIVRTIIVDHGGTVTLQNRAGGGLRAMVRLPGEPAPSPFAPQPGRKT